MFLGCAKLVRATSVVDVKGRISATDTREMAIVFSRCHDVERDLAALEALHEERGAASARALFSRSYMVESDLLAVTGCIREDAIGGKPSVEALKALSSEMAVIEAPIGTLVATQLDDYRRRLPDSPLFAVATLFGPLSYGRLETALTRGLAYLMDPKESHGFGIEIARRIVALGDPKNAGAISAVHAVLPERAILQPNNPTSRPRIDIWAQGSWSDDRMWTLCVEAKIDAPESDEQLAQYESGLPMIGDWVGIFLTTDGRQPSSATKKTWQAVGIRELAETLARYYGTVRTAPGADFLRLFIAGLFRDILHISLPLTESSSGAFQIAYLLQAVDSEAGHES